MIARKTTPVKAPAKAPAKLAKPAKSPAPVPKTKPDRHFVTALARGLDVLSCFRSGDKQLGNQDIAQRCKLPKSTISRLTYTLTKLGYLHHNDESGKYRLGVATLGLGSAMLARLDARQMARPLMQELADFSHGMVSLGMRDKLAMIYVENCRSESALTLSLDIGSRIPLATTAMGRAYLAVIAESERTELLERIRGRDEKAWPGIRAGIEKGLKQYRDIGCCCSFGEWQKDVNAIAVAFQPGGGLPAMAISCGGPAFNLDAKFLTDKVRPRLVDMVRRIEASLGS
ncbi:MAG: IclR family transcriptional regulator [Sterolibacterium sp.]